MTTRKHNWDPFPLHFAQTAGVLAGLYVGVLARCLLRGCCGGYSLWLAPKAETALQKRMIIDQTDPFLERWDMRRSSSTAKSPRATKRIGALLAQLAPFLRPPVMLPCLSLCLAPPTRKKSRVMAIEKQPALDVEMSCPPPPPPLAFCV
eukprot:2161229-Amphidinium_carterae.1